MTSPRNTCHAFYQLHLTRLRGDNGSRLQDSGESGSRKVARKPQGVWGERVVVPVSIVFNTSFRYTSFLYTLWLVNHCDSFFNTNVNHLASRAQSNKHVEHVKPSYAAPFDVMTLDILTQETVFLEVGGLRYLKRFLQALPCRYCSLIRYFTALSLFSLVCRLRPWHRLGKREGIGTTLDSCNYFLPCSWSGWRRLLVSQNRSILWQHRCCIPRLDRSCTHLWL